MAAQTKRIQESDTIRSLRLGPERPGGFCLVQLHLGSRVAMLEG